MAAKRVLSFGVSHALVVGALCASACSGKGEGGQEPVLMVNPGPCAPGQDPVKDSCIAQPKPDAAPDSAPDSAPDAAPEIKLEQLNINPGPDELPALPPAAPADMEPDQAFVPDAEKAPEPIRVNPGPYRPEPPKPKKPKLVNTAPSDVDR
jgi:hypothetical protein